MGKTESNFPEWAPIAGIIFASMTILFFMGLVLASLFGYEVPSGSRFLVLSVLAIGIALTLAFIGGEAAAKGKLPIPFLNQNPIEFSAAGGIAVFFITLIIGNVIYGSQSEQIQLPSSPSGNGIENEDPAININEGDQNDGFVTLTILTTQLPLGAKVVISTEGEILLQTTVGVDNEINLRVSNKYLDKELKIEVSAAGFSQSITNIILTKDRTVMPEL